MHSHTCPLCTSQETQYYTEDKKRQFFQCSQCQLVFVDPGQLPSQIREKQEYDLHENGFEDHGYTRFLSRVSEPLIQQLSVNEVGLDFGCGPAPVLAQMLSNNDLPTTCYDPFYFPDRKHITGHERYDFIVCTEAIEHFHQPHKELELLYRLLKPGGLLAIMTKRVLSKEKFQNWHYKNDMTHVSFFSVETFKFVALSFGYDLTIVSDDVVFLKKRPTLLK